MLFLLLITSYKYLMKDDKTKEIMYVGDAWASTAASGSTHRAFTADKEGTG